MWDDELTIANKAFLDQLPPEMVELASEAVELQEKWFNPEICVKVCS